MASTSIESSPASFLHQESEIGLNFGPMFSPSTDKRFWSTLRSRVDTILQNKDPAVVQDVESIEGGGASILKEDSALLLQGFDSVAQTLSQLSSNLENAMQRAKDLSGPPSLTEVLRYNLEKSKDTEEHPINAEETEADEANIDDEKRGQKRKLDSSESSEDGVEDAAASRIQELAKIKKAKNIAMSMATKAAMLARELKSMKSELGFMQERCTLLEEDNQKLRIGFSKGLGPEEDDLVRLQLETLLAEKSRLANENANLMRENRCLHQLVEYHQLTSQDLSASYENLVTTGMCLDLSSSSSPPVRRAPPANDDQSDEGSITPPPKEENNLGVCKHLDEYYDN